MNNTSKRRVSLQQLRTAVDPEAIVGEDAFSTAEQQAYHFLTLTGTTEPDCITDAVAALPRFRIDIVPNLPSSGSSEWDDGHWHILLNGDEPPVRQRFSLAHELKHILDHPYRRDHPTIYANQPESERSEERRRIEAICDYFAGCLLVPKPWLQSEWANGTQSVDGLAKKFGVSRQAMIVRLDQTGLKASQQRYGTARSLNRVFDGVKQRGRKWGSSLRHRQGRRYYRSAHPRFARD